MHKQMPCPKCQTNGEFNFMLYSQKNKWYICAKCKGYFTVTPRDDDYAIKIAEDEIVELMREMYAANLPAKDPIPAGRAAKGGGSRSKSGGKKAPRKKTVHQLYREL